MSYEVSSLEIYHWIKENKELLEGARFEKAWQINDIIVLKFNAPGKGSKELVISKKYIFLSSYVIEKPQTPTNFAMLLRKHLKGKFLRELKQQQTDRVVELVFDDYVLIAEIFTTGNVILIEKQSKKILAVMEPKEWKTRSLKPGKEYKEIEHPLSLEEVSSEHLSDIEAQENVARYLIKKLGLAKVYANYISDRCNKDAFCITKHIKELLENKQPCLCNDDKKVYTYCLSNECKQKQTINEVIEQVAIEELKEQKIKKQTKSSKKAELEKKIAYMEQGLKKLIAQKQELEKKVELLNYNYALLEELIKRLQSKKYEHDLIEDIDYDANKALINIDGVSIEINYALNPYQNITSYYEKIKELKTKISNLEKEIEKWKEQASNLKEEEEISIKIHKKQTKKYWYESFRYFFTLKGRLFVSGKDATSNEVLIKKHMESKDLVFHTLLPGSPFGLLKQGQEAEEHELIEAGQFLVSFSKAWKANVYSEDVFYVLPEQVSKKAPSGEYIGKGSFMIYGKKHIFKVSLELAFAYDEQKKEVVFGPAATILQKYKHYAIIIPGQTRAKDLIPKIKKKLALNLKKEDSKLVWEWDDEYFRERIPFGKATLRGRV